MFTPRHVAMVRSGSFHPSHRHRFTASTSYCPTYRDATAAALRHHPSCAASRQSVKSPGGVPLGPRRCGEWGEEGRREVLNKLYKCLTTSV